MLTNADTGNKIRGRVACRALDMLHSRCRFGHKQYFTGSSIGFEICRGLRLGFHSERGCC